MINRYASNETNFEHNETVLQAKECVVSEVENGLYDIELMLSLEESEKVSELDIIKVPTPNGKQLFRLVKPFKTLSGIRWYGRHIFYDLSNNYIENIRPTNTNVAGALNSILRNTAYPTPFMGLSKINESHTANYVRMNPVEAIISAENSILTRWGGYLMRDNFKIEIVARGEDRGYTIEYRKNLDGIEVDVDYSDVITKIMPTWVNENNVVEMLPEKYIASDLIDHYPYPMIEEYRVELSEEEKKLSTTEIQKLVRKKAKEFFTEQKQDRPKINYKVNFLDLSKIDEYKDFKHLFTLKMHDTVTIKVNKLNVDVKAKVISYKYDCIQEKYLEIELGTFKQSLASVNKQIYDLVETINSGEFLDLPLKEAIDKISGNQGGNVVIRKNEQGEPFEILVMDTKDVKTAKNVIRINQNGIGFGKNGINGSWNTAMTIDGHIVANYVDSGTFNGSIVKTGVLSDKNGRFTINMDTGAINFDGDLVYDPQARKLTVKGAAIDEINARVVNVTNLNADNLTDGTVRRDIDNRDFKSSRWGSTQMDGSSCNFSSQSSYITIKDTGGAGQVDINGTIAAKRNGHVVELNGGGLYINGRVFSTDGTMSVISAPNGTTAIRLYYNGTTKIDKLIFAGHDVYLDHGTKTLKFR